MTTTRWRLGAAIVLACALAVPGAGARQSEDVHSDNIEQLAQVPIRIDEDVFAQGSDMAFRDDLLVAGSYEGMALFRILPRAPYVRQISFFDCPGSQGDVSLVGDHVLISIDSGGSNTGRTPRCNNTDDSVGAEGIRIVDISNPRAPRQVRFVETPCGSHTHTILPDGAKTYVYVESYPLGAPTASCSPASHRKVSIVEMPTADPAKAKLAGSLDVSPEIGCHDVTVVPQRDLAVVACIAESQVWDIADPSKPVILSRIYNPSIQIHHSAGLTWDGKYMAIGDEFAGSVTGTCPGERPWTVGAMWFYDVTDPSTPIPAGYYNIPRRALPGSQEEAGYLACTTHNFNVLPMKHEGHYVASIGYRNAGISVIDFSDPSNATEIAHYLQMNDGMIPDVWSAYWYNGRIYASDNGALRGISVYELEGTGPKDVHYFDGTMNPQVQIPDFR
ncbi:MAG: hypothetical protein M3323_15970 [Actinomycetota bacterium]|nr:hypothetical protein [Actinomycetota bacterium]